MNLVELRQNLKNYNLRIDAFRLAINMGQTPPVSLAEIEETAADLFSASTIESLENLTESSATASETEREARQNLLEIARLGFLKNQTKEITREIETCLNAVSFRFENEVLGIGQAHDKLALTENAEARREIFVRLLGAKNSCTDLLTEKLAHLQEETKQLGFANVQKLFEEIIRLDFHSFSQKAQNFLEKTEKVYYRQLSGNAKETNLNEKALHFADFFYFRKQLEREKLFESKNLPSFYAKILENFNFSQYKVSNITLKQISENYQTDVFRAIVPDEVYFCFANRNGISNYMEFLRAFGRANLAAWTSKNLANRFPEFVFSPDVVLAKAYGFLFQSLLTEESFLRKTLNFWDEKLSVKIKQEAEFWLLFEIRSMAIRFNLETLFLGVSENLEELCEQGAEVFAINTAFCSEKEQIQWEVSEDFSSLKTLRAFLFAFGLREYLRERYGFDWWQKRKAFEELIDFWNAAERYQAEEMAQMIGFEMSFDLLAEQF